MQCCRAIKTKVIEGAVSAYQSLYSFRRDQQNKMLLKFELVLQVTTTLPARLQHLANYRHFNKKWATPCPFLFIFVFSIVNSKYVRYKILPMMPRFTQRKTDIGSDSSYN